MIKDCQQFEQRIQSLMDSRIDPETDEAICAHSTVCESCYESLMAYSLMHTSFLNDSDSMKIKLENLGLHEAFLRKAEEKPNRKYLFAVAASIAALILVMVALTNEVFQAPSSDLTASRLDTKKTMDLPVNNVSFESLAHIRKTLDENQIYASISELPGLRPFKAIAFCLDWFQQSWFSEDETEQSPDFGYQFDRDFDIQYSGCLKIAFCC